MEVQGEDFRVLVFDLRLEHAIFGVVDLDMSTDLERALSAHRASLVINGGFFDANRRPEGLVVSDGKTLSPLSPSLGGGVLAILGDHATLLDATNLSLPERTTFAVQARPRLVVKGASNLRSDDGRRAERTALCLRSEGRRMEIALARGDAPGRGPTLSMLADMLIARGCEEALNLDGGPSTGAAWRTEDSVKTLLPRAPVRHAITIRLRGG